MHWEGGTWRFMLTQVLLTWWESSLEHLFKLYLMAIEPNTGDNKSNLDVKVTWRF